MAMTDADGGGFLSRWARRKSAARAGVELGLEPVALRPPPPAGTVPPAPTRGFDTAAEPDMPPGATADPGAAAPGRAPPPTWDDLAELTPEADFSRYVAGNVDPGVRNAAMKKLFSDPHYNVMDGLDTYIDDYGKPDPIPPAMLRSLAQSRMLGLFDDAADETTADQATGAEAPAPTDPPHDEDPDLQLQPDDAAGADPGRPGGEDPGGDPAGQR